MENGSYIGPVIVIVGPTASGKTGTAIELALKLGELANGESLKKLGVKAGKFGGEIISADSRAIYKYMDIGTAKPSLEERQGVPHFGFDLVEPGERFTVADYKEYALSKITEIRSRGHVPIIAGGTGLYVDALIYNYQFKVRDEKHGTPEAATRVSRSIYEDRKEMDANYSAYGIKWPLETLRERISVREKELYNDDLFKETKYLVNKYGWDSQAMKSNIYQFAWKYLEGELSLDEAIEKNIFDDWHLAKRQLTWFKRNQYIIWLDKDKIVDRIIKDLQH